MEIHPQEGIKPISDFRQDSARVIKELRRTHEPIILTQRGRSVAVLLDIDTFERLEYEARLRTSYLRGVDDLNRGKRRAHSDVVGEIKKWAGD